MTRRVDEKKFTEAAALVDRRIEAASDFTARARWAQTRQGIARARLVQAAKDAWEEQRWSDARQAFEEILASDAPPLMKLQARRRGR